MITTIRKLNAGATFYLPQYPGNAYRLISGNKAEFIRHRLTNAYVGCQITVSPDQQVATDPSDPPPPDCLCCGRPAVREDMCDPCYWESQRVDMSLL